MASEDEKKNEEQDQQEPSGFQKGRIRPLPKNHPLYSLGSVVGGTYTRASSNDTKENSSNNESTKPETS